MAMSGHIAVISWHAVSRKAVWGSAFGAIYAAGKSGISRPDRNRLMGDLVPPQPPRRAPAMQPSDDLDRLHHPHIFVHQHMAMHHIGSGEVDKPGAESHRGRGGW